MCNCENLLIISEHQNQSTFIRNISWCPCLIVGSDSLQEEIMPQSLWCCLCLMESIFTLHTPCLIFQIEVLCGPSTGVTQQLCCVSPHEDGACRRGPAGVQGAPAAALPGQLVRGGPAASRPRLVWRKIKNFW